jgi:hypothetical protein
MDRFSEGTDSLTVYDAQVENATFPAESEVIAEEVGNVFGVKSVEVENTVQGYFDRILKGTVRRLVFPGHGKQDRGKI